MAARHTSPLQALLVDERFDGDIYAHEPMSRHTAYRLGGPARFYVRVASVGALTRLVDVCESEGVPWAVVGRGSEPARRRRGFPASSSLSDGISAACASTTSRIVSWWVPACCSLRRGSRGLPPLACGPRVRGGDARHHRRGAAHERGSRDEWIGSRVLSVTTFSRERAHEARGVGDFMGIPHLLYPLGRGGA